MEAKEAAMPLRDHFRLPVSKKVTWEGFHAMWPASIVRQLRNQLPPGYVAEPRVHLGTLMEIDFAALQADNAPRPPEEYEYEVRVYDLEMPLDLEPSYEQACHDLWIA